MARVAVILSGCGYLDGAEIRESVITLLALDRKDVEVALFAPDTLQMHVVNHYSGEVVEDEARNVLVESARIARGKVLPLTDCDVNTCDGLILPGGYGVAKNVSDLAVKGVELRVHSDFLHVLRAFYLAKKPIGAMCIAPAVLVAAFSDDIQAKVTLGEDADGLIAALGGVHENCSVSDIVVDDEHNIVTSPAYMQEAPLSQVADGIEALVNVFVNRL